MNKPSFLSHSNNGPWYACNHPIDFNNWYIYNTITGKYKKIGKIGAKRVNYFDNAVNEANYRNEKINNNQ